MHVMIRNYLSKNLTCVCALPAALLGLPPGKSLLHRWQNPDGSFKYRELCSIKGSNPIALERDCKVVAILMAELFRLDAGRDVKEGYETDLLRNNGKPLAFFNDKTMYSKLGMFIWTDFWIAGSNFGQLSKLLHAADRASINKVAGTSFILYAKS